VAKRGEEKRGRGKNEEMLETETTRGGRKRLIPRLMALGPRSQRVGKDARRIVWGGFGGGGGGGVGVGVFFGLLGGGGLGCLVGGVFVGGFCVVC